jgi:hypothetical protein
MKIKVEFIVEIDEEEYPNMKKTEIRTITKSIAEQFGEKSLKPVVEEALDVIELDKSKPFEDRQENISFFKFVSDKELLMNNREHKPIRFKIVCIENGEMWLQMIDEPNQSWHHFTTKDFHKFVEDGVFIIMPKGEAV